MNRKNKPPVKDSLTKKKQEYETEEQNSDNDTDKEVQTQKTVKRKGSAKPQGRKIARVIERTAKTQNLDTNKESKFRKRTLTNKFADDDNDTKSDVECATHTFARENDDLSEEESEEDEDIHETIRNSKGSEENFCPICKNQNITKNQKNFKKHLSVHSKSMFIANWMKEHYKKSGEKDKFFCSKCFQQDRAKNKKKAALDGRNYMFGVKFPLKHLFEAHIEDLKGHEKEFLKQIDFFQMVGRNRRHFDQVVDQFEFNFENLREYSKIYYCNSIQSNNKKRLLWGEMSHRLWDILKESRLPGKPNKMTKKLIDEYLLQKNQTTTTLGKSSLKKPSLTKVDEDEKEEEDYNSPGQVDMPESTTIRPVSTSQGSKRIGEDISQEDLILKKLKEDRDKYALAIADLTVEKCQKEHELKEKIQSLEKEHQLEIQKLKIEYKLEIQDLEKDYKLKIQNLEKELAKFKLKVEST